MKGRKIVSAGLAVVLLGAVVDLGTAMHAEHAISTQVQSTANLETPPSVYVGGMPYLAAAVTKEIPLVEVHSTDVEVPVLGLVNASTTLRDVTVEPQQVLSGQLAGAQASTLSRSISLDGVALGRLLDMTDLDIAHPKNISPGGGTSAEATLTGTIAGDTEPTTVEVDLRLVGERFYMRPTDAPDERAREAFSLSLDTRKLPLPGQATKVSLRGGTISFEVQRRDIPLHLGLLSPLEIDGEFDSNGKQAGAAAG
ncbi:DUF2993 domain-containing protein [Corynebacterium lizhenjunii]|uniref:LmeA family phospholipid-binding protein n=1 Tax=Corynebacterium lizhenjunii TaxID=2709394 RepID=UPI0013E9A0EF|nr:DUF2993 domain-containing protein [Corynebacterium lizhenjunii]